MKYTFVVLFLAVLALGFFNECQGQPKYDYEIYSAPVPDAVKYHFFLEKNTGGTYQLTEGMDYLSPDVTALKVGESDTPIFTVNFDNDGAEYKDKHEEEHTNVAAHAGGLYGLEWFVDHGVQQPGHG